MNVKIFYVFICCILFLCACKKSEYTKAEKANPANAELENWNQLIAQHPNVDSFYFMRGTYYFNQEAYDSAIEDYQMAIKIDSTRQPNYYFYLSDAYLFNLQSRDASDIMDKALSIFPNSAETILRSARLKLILKQYFPAMTVLDKLFVRDPQNSKAYLLAGQIFYEMGDTGRAVNAYQKAVDFNPDLREGWIRLGELLCEIGTLKCIPYFENAIRLDSLDPEVYHKKAFCFAQLGKRDKAIESYKSNIIRFPAFEPSFYNLGLLYLEMDSLDLALEHFTLAIRINPREASNYYERGLIYQKKNQTKLARIEYEQALQLDTTLQLATEALKQLN